MTLKAPAPHSPPQPRGWLASMSQFRRGGIAIALLIRVLVFSTVVTLSLTILQLTLSYRSERGRLDSRFGEIEQASSRSLSESLWALDSKQLEEQLEGIVRLPSIRAAEVRETASSAHSLTVLRGKPQDSCYVRRYSGLADTGCPEDFSSRLEIEA